MGNSSEYWVINRRGDGCFDERRKESSKPTSEEMAEQQNCRFLNVKIVWLEGKGVLLIIGKQVMACMESSEFLLFGLSPPNLRLAHYSPSSYYYYIHRIFKKYNN